MSLKTLPGQSFPLGATVFWDGVNFCLFTKNATQVELLLFENEKNHNTPTHTIVLDPVKNKTFYYWHIFIPGLKEGQLYAYRVQGPFDPETGHRFKNKKVLIDPYARAVVTNTYDRADALHDEDNCATAIKSVVVNPQNYDWEDDHPLNHAFSKSIIYELHVGGFTKHPSSGLSDELRGTYKGLIEKIPYLKKLGITAVELLPVQQFDPYDVPSDLINYWGYSPLAFFAPHTGYASTDDPLAAVNEFRDMVKALHKAGIEVILDVVFNHTAEGNEHGPTISFKGLENRGYYILEENRAWYTNYSGTGNTLKANHSIVRRMIIDCLRHWVSEMHVDGFRFDLAAVLARNEDGHTIPNPPVLWEIESDPVLASTKIIAEAWDLGNYQLGNFVGDKWAEWNGLYRDDVRMFVKGDYNMVGALAQRVSASPDLFKEVLRNPNRSINFITCHDGFTLNDLVSYNQKHNKANKEDNRDGHNENHSWNCGVEGKSNDPGIEALRVKQMKNFLALLMVSQGTPMLLMGDEIRRTQSGNNNAYCQDNEINWFNWDLVKKESEILSFVKKLIQFNLSTEFFQEEYYWNAPDHLGSSTFILHGTKLGQPDWSHQSRSLAFSLKNSNYDKYLHVMINAFWEPLSFELPKNGVRNWRQIIDTSLPHPKDIFTEKKAPKYSKNNYLVQDRSVVVLLGKKG